MIKPEEFNNKLEELKKNYKDLYEMFKYLDESRDGYIDENMKLKQYTKTRKKLFIYIFICFIIEFILFLIASFS